LQNSTYNCPCVNTGDGNCRLLSANGMSGSGCSDYSIPKSGLLKFWMSSK
ncbi:unnamed protein product, partial [Allacma fusca]